MAQIISDRSVPGFSQSEGGLLVPDSPLKSIENQKRAVGGRIDFGSHFQHRYSLMPREGATPVEQLDDCVKQLRNLTGRRGLSLSHAVQMTVFVPSEGYADTVKQLEKHMEDVYGGKENVPPISFVGQTPADGRKSGMEAVVIEPKKGHELMINPGIIGADGIAAVGRPKAINEGEMERLLGMEEGSLKGVGEARYSVVIVGDEKWVYAAGLAGNPDSTNAGEKAWGALAKEMAILVREGIFERDAVVNTGLLNSHHTVHDIIGDNYNHLNVVRDEMYKRMGIYKYPSATGIGSFSSEGDVIIGMIGAKGVDYEPVVVVQHGEAHQYSMQFMKQQVVGKPVGGQVDATGVGKPVSVPKFNRALYLPGHEVVLVSGTASVEKGKGLLYGPEAFEAESQANGGRGVQLDVTEIVDSVGMKRIRERGLGVIAGADNRVYFRAETAAEAQTIVTIRNMTRLLAAKGMSLNDLAHSRVYVADLDDSGRVMDLVGKIFGNNPTQCVEAPVCYKGWLVEIEGIAGKNKSLIQ
ncbi:MAG: RidA family protein [Candidatus Altiarchaeota archaeon]